MTGRTGHWRLSGGLHGLSRLLDRLRQFTESHAVPVAMQRSAVLALEEIVTNVLDHGSRDRTPSVEIRADAEDGTLTIVVIDDGPAFDPLSVAPPPTDQPLQDRPIGGLGLLLVRHVMDEVTYARVDDTNQLTMRVRYSA